MVVPPPTAKWRDSARDARFFFLDAKAAFPFVFFLLHIRLWTFFVALAATLAFTALNYFGFSLGVFFRFARAFVAGRRRVAMPWWM